MSTKAQFMTTSSPTSKKLLHSNHFKYFILLSITVLIYKLNSIQIGVSYSKSRSTFHADADQDNFCPIYPKIYPVGYSNHSFSVFKTEEYRSVALERFQEAIRIPTEIFDDMGDVNEDNRWNIYEEFKEYLRKTFPLIHSSLTLDIVNSYGLVYTWNGSDSSLKPIMLMAHQDVVPVLPDTADLWTHKPYSADFDGKYIWGRGAVDDKDMLVSIMSAVTLLLENGFSPKRTIVLSFGCDEEASGEGAMRNANFLQEIYGSDHPFFSILDEGSGLGYMKGLFMAAPSIAEKGYLDLEITVHARGGHSSVPPDHTAIGKLAQLINLIENAPYPYSIDSKNPFLQFLKCLAAYSEEVPKYAKEAILDADKSKNAQEKVIEYLLTDDILAAAITQTTQAIDIIEGGLKINALPERVSVVVDHRIDVHSSCAEVIDKVLGNTMTIANKHGMAVLYNGQYFLGNESNDGYFEITHFSSELEPAPISPTYGHPAWELLAGTIRHVFEDFKESNGSATTSESPVIVTPSLDSGNTDTRFYWNLSDCIYRFTPVKLSEGGGAHTVDEKITLNSHIEGIVFFHEYIQIASTYDECP